MAIFLGLVLGISQNPDCIRFHGIIVFSNSEMSLKFPKKLSLNFLLKNLVKKF